MGIALAALMASTVGFLAGMLVFKRSLVWCRRCGCVLACPDCARTGRPYRSA
jgi:hypothetical protein